MPGGPFPPVSPIIYKTTDANGGTFVASITFSDTSPYTLISVTVTRTATCLYEYLYFGLGSDGTPNTTIAQAVTTGTTNVVNAAALAALGLTTASQITAGQITAGP
jgi:hypothetical protein